MDEARTARLLFVPELTAGLVNDSDLAGGPVRAAVHVPRVPARPLRVVEQVRYKLGRLSFEGDVVAPLVRARRTALGERAKAPPRFLVRVDEFPHYRAWDDPARYGTERFERFHEILAAAGVPYLLAVLPRVSREPLSPLGDTGQEDAGQEGAGHEVGALSPSERASQATRDSRSLDDGERAMLARLGDERVSFALHGLTHRTRFRSPRRHSELCGLSPAATASLLDAGLGELAGAGVATDVFVPPYNRFDAAQLEALAERFEVVCGGPESIGQMGFQSTPQWRGETVYLPSYAPFYGRAGEVRPAVERAIDGGWGMWVPVVLHWGWEADAGWEDLEELARVLAPHAVAWEDFLAAVERSKQGAGGAPVAHEHSAPERETSRMAPERKRSQMATERGSGSQIAPEREAGR